MALSLGEIGARVWRRKFSALFVFLLVNAAVIAVCIYAPRIYEAASFVLIGTDTPGQAAIEPTRRAELLNSQVVILQSDQVLRKAIISAGTEKLLGGHSEPSLKDTLLASDFVSTTVDTLGLRGLIRRADTAPPAETLPPIDRALLMVRSSLSVRVEPNTEILKISFRHSNPVSGAEFVNAVVAAFTERHTKLYNDARGLGLFREQKQRYEAELEKAAARLDAFVKTNKTYEIDEQRKLALTRSSELASALATTRSSVAEKEAKAASLSQQLLQLRPVALSPHVSGLVRDLSRSAPNGVERDSTAAEITSSSPPLLLVRAYQDMIQALFSINADLAGLRSLRKQQENEFGKVDGELSALSARQAEAERLEREVSLAREAVVQYGRQAAEEELRLAASTENLSRVHIVQTAVAPLLPVFPKTTLFIAGGFLAGILAAIAVAVAFGANRATRRDVVLYANNDVEQTQLELARYPRSIRPGKSH